MIRSLDDLEDGHFYRPAEIAPLLPVAAVKGVIALCQDGELEHAIRPGYAGKPSYWITGASVKAWRRRNVIKPKKVA